MGSPRRSIPAMTPPRVVIAASIVAAGYVASLFVSNRLSYSHRGLPRPTTMMVRRSSDPKTVQARQIDATSDGADDELFAGGYDDVPPTPMPDDGGVDDATGDAPMTGTTTDGDGIDDGLLPPSLAAEVDRMEKMLDRVTRDVDYIEATMLNQDAGGGGGDGNANAAGGMEFYASDRRRRRALMLDSFSDPKTIQARQTDATGYGGGGGGGVAVLPRPAMSDDEFMSSGGNNVPAGDASTGTETGGYGVDGLLTPSLAAEFNAVEQMLDSVRQDVDNIEGSMTMTNDAGGAGAGAGGGAGFYASDVVEPERSWSTVRPYNVDNALATTRAFRYTLFFFVYESKTDEFAIVHNIQGCDHGCARIYRVGPPVAYALRKNFPERFRGAESDDLVMMMSTGDVPRVRAGCLGGTHCGSDEFAPILNFGSSFVAPEILPSMITMPIPVRPHLPCFDEWQVTDGRNGVCQDLSPKTDFADGSIKGGLVFGEELGIVTPENALDGTYWNELVPQIIWRGTDFHFLHTMFPDMRPPRYETDIAPYEGTMPPAGSPDDDRRWAIQKLWEMGSREQLLPRWRGVLMTSEAEIEAREREDATGETQLPWVNIKFSSVNVNSKKLSAADNPDYQVLQKLGIAAIGEYVGMVDQAKYRYHIDLGGGGGTTWTGTIEKLAMPGVLFHHLTPTKDWFHDLIKPWVHYIPIETDLSDLREKFEWAEANPMDARNIAEEGTRFVRWMGGPEGFSRLYQERLVAPLRDVVDAYVSLPEKYAGRSALDVINERGETSGFQIVARCSGRPRTFCSKVAQ